MSQAWRNRRFTMYQSVCRIDELSNWKLKALLDKYGKAFDDNFTYRIGGSLKTLVVRNPLWMGWQHESGKFTERYKPKNKAQTKLLSFRHH